jgi:hypothetical protein
MSEDQHDAMAVDSGNGVEEHDEQQQELKVILEVTGVTLEEEGTVVGSNGVLIITSRCVRWSLGPTGSDLSREWDYQHILLHAVSREAEKPNIYCQIAVGAPPGPDDDESQVQEVKFIPSNADMLQHMWDALSEGAALNPDPRTWRS